MMTPEHEQRLTEIEARVNAADISLRCEHSKCIPAFDEAAASSLDSYEVRKRWPRFDGICPDCGVPVIAYASLAHYLLGDW